MKKVIALLLIVCLALMLSLPIGAATPNDVDFIVNTDGENITIDVNTNFTCGSLQGALKFDNKEISYEEIDINSDLESKNTVNDTVKLVNGAVKLAFVGDVKNGTKGNWATLTFKGSKAKFDFSKIQVYAADGSALTVNPYVVFRGDSNDDGIIDIRDLVCLKNVSVSSYQPTAGKEKNCDVNADGVIANSNDLVKMCQILLNN